METPESAADRFGPWQVGMTRAAVTAVTEHAPYTPVQMTGGLETKHGRFMDRPASVSFVLDDHDQLKLIQVWAYEGRSYSKALESWHTAYRYLIDHFGPVRMGDTPVPSDLDDPGALATWLPPEFQKPQEPIDLNQLADGAKLTLHPVRADLRIIESSKCEGVYASIIRQPEIGGYFVFLFVRTPGS